MNVLAVREATKWAADYCRAGKVGGAVLRGRAGGATHHYKTLGHCTLLQDPGPVCSITSLVCQPTGPSSDGAEHIQI